MCIEEPPRSIDRVTSGRPPLYSPPRARRWPHLALYALVIGWGVAMSFFAFSLGVSHGIVKGGDACAAGDTVLVDPAVGGE